MSHHLLDELEGEALLDAVRAMRWDLVEVPILFGEDDLSALQRAERRLECPSCARSGLERA